MHCRKNALWLVAIAGIDVWRTGVADCTLPGQFVGRIVLQIGRNYGLAE